MDFDTALAAFVEANQAAADKEHHASWGSKGIRYTTLTVEHGSTYAKIVAENHGQKSVWGFVVKKANKKFQVGDILKAATWKAPATNFKRGNIFEGAKVFSWTGVQ